MSRGQAGTPAVGASEVWLSLQPLDVTAFRDGRPFSAGAGWNAATTLPRPTTTAGAAGAALGAGSLPEELAGPLPARIDPAGDRLDLWFPCPRDLVLDADDGTVRRLRVAQRGTRPGSDLDAEENASGPVEVFPAGRGEALGGWLTSEQMGRYLAGQDEGLCAELAEELPAGPLKAERRVGLARSPRRTAAPGYLYAAEFWRPDPDEVGFACRAWFKGAVPPLARTLVRLGGESRLAQVRLHPPRAAPLDDLAAKPQGRGVLVYLATPAVFAGGWMPTLEEEGARLVAACMEGPEPVGAFHSEAGQRVAWALRWAVAAGSVYWLRFPSKEAAARFAERHHGHCLVQADRLLQSAGFGMCLVGRW